MTPEWFAAWWPAFITTILSETPIVALFLRDRIGLGPALALGVGLQCVTHPLFWLAWGLDLEFFYGHYEAAVFGFELVIYLVEAALIWLALPPWRPADRWPSPVLALVAAASANTVSLMIGFLQEAAAQQ